MSDLERELEQELHRVLDPVSRLAIPARRAPRHGSLYGPIAGGAGAALTVKVLTGVAIAAAAATVAGAATTGSLNPVDWTQGMSRTVESCKTALTAGHHGIGECVSDIANQHGQAVASAARHQGKPAGNGQSNGEGGGGSNGHGNDKGNGNGHGKSGNPGGGARPAVSPGGLMQPGPPPGA